MGGHRDGGGTWGHRDRGDTGMGGHRDEGTKDPGPEGWRGLGAQGVTEGLGVQGARETRRQTEGCRTGGAHLAGQRDSGTGGHGGGEVLQAPNPRPPSPWLMLFVQILLLGRIWTWRGAFWGVPPKKKTELWGFSAPSRRHQKGWEKGKVRKGQWGWWGGQPALTFCGGFGVLMSEAHPHLGDEGGGGESVSWGQPADVFPVVPDVLVGSLGAPPQPLGCGCGRDPCCPPPPHRAVPWCPRPDGPGGHRGHGWSGWSWWPCAGSDPIVPQAPCGHPGGQQSPPTPHPPGAERRSRGGRWQSRAACPQGAKQQKVCHHAACPVPALLTPREGARSREEPEQRDGAGGVNAESVPQTGLAPV